MNNIYYKLPRPESYNEKIERLYPEQIKNDLRVKGVTFQVTEDCCMACTYCY